jgi:hypothetical protein
MVSIGGLVERQDSGRANGGHRSAAMPAWTCHEVTTVQRGMLVADLQRQRAEAALNGQRLG